MNEIAESILNNTVRTIREAFYAGYVLGRGSDTSQPDALADEVGLAYVNWGLNEFKLDSHEKILEMFLERVDAADSKITLAEVLSHMAKKVPSEPQDPGYEVLDTIRPYDKSHMRYRVKCSCGMVWWTSDDYQCKTCGKEIVGVKKQPVTHRSRFSS